MFENENHDHHVDYYPLQMVVLAVIHLYLILGHQLLLIENEYCQNLIYRKQIGNYKRNLLFFSTYSSTLLPSTTFFFGLLLLLWCCCEPSSKLRLVKLPRPPRPRPPPRPPSKFPRPPS